MHPHAAHPIVGYIVLALFFAGFFSAFLATVDFSELNREIAEALRQACAALELRDPEFSQKAIYAAMEISKGQWSKVLNGEQPLPLTRLHMAPMAFYIEAFQRLMAIKARAFALTKVEDACEEQRVA